MKRTGFYGVLGKTLSIGLFVLVVLSVGCDTGNTGDNDPELAKWAGTWNPVYWYLDDSGLDASFQAQYDALPEAAKTMMQVTSLDDLRDMTMRIAETDFGSFVIKGNTITFYEQKANAKNPSGNVIETVTYTFKGPLTDKHPREGEFIWSAFEGDTAGAHKYLLFADEAERDTPEGPLHFHIRYGSKGFDDLLMTPDNYNLWSPTIVSYNTTIAELQEFMSLD
jgi:Zn/Cd-binding protein ZinT